MNLLNLLAATGAPAPATYIEDVFSAYTYTGNGSTQTITTGLPLSTKGGMNWRKARSTTTAHEISSVLLNGIGGANTALYPNTTAAYGGGDLSTFTSTGFNLSLSSGNTNGNGNSEISWSFVNALKFFKEATATVSGGVTATVDLSSLGTVGMVAVKRTDSTSAWFVYHRSCTSGKLVYLNTTAAETTDGSVTLSGTTLSLVGGTIANGTYIVYAWAHDTASTGLIQCDTVTSDGSGNATVTLGWEPQFILTKRLSGAVGDWKIYDTSRGLIATVTGVSQRLMPNLANAEGGDTGFNISATGFSGSGVFAASTPYIYLAIRRGPMKLPTSGTQVYNAIARTGTGAAATVTGVGFPPDLSITRVKGEAWNYMTSDRLRGADQYLMTDGTGAEGASGGTGITSYNMDGFSLGSGAVYNQNTKAFINWFFRRYPGVFDEVCYTGTNSTLTLAHSLGAIPELIIVKDRSNTGSWGVYSAGIPVANLLYLNLDMAYTGGNEFNSTTPTDTQFYLGGPGAPTTNALGNTYVAYLFATLAGISKVGSYTGNGSNLTLNMGFAAGARFFMCKRTDSAGDWFVWDSTRGIVAGNDPHLSLNTTAAEVTTDDSVDPDNSGIIVNELAATHINVNNATYIYLAFA